MPESARLYPHHSSRLPTSLSRNDGKQVSNKPAAPRNVPNLTNPPPKASTLHAAGVPKLYDPGFATTIACKSSITFLDGPAGILRYRGYPIEQLATKTSFDEVAFLLLFKRLPTPTQLNSFRTSLASNEASSLPPTVAAIIHAFPNDTHPMTILVATLASLTAQYPHLNPSIKTGAIYSTTSVRIEVIRIVLGLFPTIAGEILRHTSSISIRSTLNDRPARKKNTQGGVPNDPPSYTKRFLNALNPSLDEHLVSAFDTLLILHADHEQNCSTSAVRHLSSSGVDVFSALSAGAAALYGPLHGGASEAVVHMLSRIGSPKNVPRFIEGVKEKKERLMGFGHRVYKTYDPRARIVRGLAQTAVNSGGAQSDALIEVAYALEQAALSDDFFISRKLYPNIDFYSGIIYRCMGVEPPFFTLLFALSRISGWLAHWLEFLDDPDRKIARPHQHYTGVLGPNPVPSLENRNENDDGEDAENQVNIPARL